MTTQVFRGSTASDARRAAIRALGADALIVDTRHVRRRGLGGLLGARDVEVEAAAAARLPAQLPAPKPRPSSNRPFADLAYERRAGENARHDDSLTTLRSEVRSELRAARTSLERTDRVASEALIDEVAALRAMLEQLTPAGPAPGDRVGALLRTRGIEGVAAATIARAVGTPSTSAANAEARVRDVLAEMLGVAPWPVAEARRSVIALVGPAGVGKTTTAAKLAARARMAGRTVAIIGCDRVRIGAIEQLRRYAEILGASFASASTRAELEDAIAAVDDVDVVIVDTAGRPPRGAQPELLFASAAFARTVPAVADRTRSVLLCVPASVRAVDAAHIAKLYRPVEPTALVVTRMDETPTPSGIVHAALATKLPIAALCDGLRVPEDIAPASLDALLARVLPLPRRPRAEGTRREAET